jgi:hypothetical protein
MLVLALDIATRTGFACGRVGELPTFGSIRFGNASSNDNVIFAGALNWCARFLDPQPRPELLAIESLLPPDAMGGRTTRNVRDRLAGLHGIVRAVACLRDIPRIEAYAVGDVRQHFIGDRKAKREVAKRETMRRCVQLDWHVQDDNAADALATWSFACSLIDPRLAPRTVPLFNRRVAL